MKSGKRTTNAYGDLAAEDPSITPFIKVFTVEAKRGSSYGHPADLLDTRPSKAVRPFEACLNQARNSAVDAGSLMWLLVARRDYRIDMVYAPIELHKRLDNGKWLKRPPVTVFNMMVNQEDKTTSRFHFFSMPMLYFFENMNPEEVATWAPNPR